MTESSLIKIPDDIIECRSIGHNGVIFRRKDGTLWMHGKLGDTPYSNFDEESKDGLDVIKTKPIKLDWNGEIIFSGDYIIFKSNNLYYIVGRVPWTYEYYETPKLLPIDNVINIFARDEFIYICTNDECFVAGSNEHGLLGIDDKCERKEEFVKVNWYPLHVVFHQFMVTIKMKDNKWYGLGCLDDIHSFSLEAFVNPPFTEEEFYGYSENVIPTAHKNVFYPRLLVDNMNEWCERQLEYQNENFDYKLCRRCNYDINTCATHDRYCLTCNYELGKLSKKDEQQALFELKHLNQDNLPKIQTFLTDKFAPLIDDLKDFNRKLTCFNIDDLIRSVKFENRLLVKQLIHDKLLEYMDPNFMDVRYLKENNYMTYELPLEPNDLGVLDWRSCYTFNKMDFTELIDKINNKENVYVLNFEHNDIDESKLDEFYKFVTQLPNLKIIILNDIKPDNEILNKLSKLDNIKFIRLTNRYVKNDPKLKNQKLIFNKDTKLVKEFKEMMKKYTHNYFPNYPKYLWE